LLENYEPVVWVMNEYAPSTLLLYANFAHSSGNIDMGELVHIISGQGR
jgi:hypothetical protein